ncbi:hypothetical protein RRG08_055390 [Elysia crispata]|uniref:Uncharacterized protein n=1 Tax=Elysia crispata TaxID=231223 RepID=A0AAE1AQF0_9GAST|nr:hypothetical protein RRG08_055390 [Elysia crispata]
MIRSLSTSKETSDVGSEALLLYFFFPFVEKDLCVIVNEILWLEANACLQGHYFKNCLLQPCLQATRHCKAEKGRGQPAPRDTCIR